jgi:hypothetical protein
MFFKKKRLNNLTTWGPLSEIAWDDKTVRMDRTERTVKCEGNANY